MKKIILTVFAGSLLIFSNCTKTGPIGPQGPQGQTGNANVIGGNPFTVSNWSYSTDDIAYKAEFSLADITTAVANNGLVMIYVQYPDGSWRSLPDVYKGTSFAFSVVPGGFDLYYSNVDGSIPAFPGNQVFRTVVVPSSYRKAYPNETWTDYNATVAMLSATLPTPAVQ